MSKNPGFGTSYSYDGHGNILSLSRGKGDGSSDLLTMSYIGNRLHGMTDGNGGSLIPEPLAVTLPADTEHYAYDANGNMTRDHVSGITAMSYNRINLPETITVIDSGKVSNVSYSYTSDGTKQRASVTDASGESLTKDWCSNLVYLNGELDRILIPGGYIKDGSYRFFLTDHLGSVRAVADSEGNVLETIDYYPYGQEISDGRASGNGAAAFDETLQPYRFNGKESQSFAGLPYLDYGARFYHPLSTRWTTMDPLAEKYYFLSPYAYCSGNPVNFVDPDGKAGEFFWDVANVVLGGKSLVSNIKSKNIGGAIVDGVGLVVDAAAAIIPFIPGGAGTVIRGLRTVDKVADTSKAFDKTTDAAKGAANLASDVRKAPPANGGKGGKHGGAQHNNSIDEMVGNVKDAPGVEDVRKNQAQVDANGNKVGNNRPDVQYNKDGVHYNHEFDYSQKNSDKHKNVIEKNDPNSVFVGTILKK